MPVELTVEADGTMTAAGPIYGASGSAIPLAFASVSGIDGSKQSGTSNLQTAFNRGTKRFEITINNVKYDRLNYTAVATMSGWSGTPLFVNTDSLNGKLLVDFRDQNGNLHQADFQVVVFKAH